MKDVEREIAECIEEPVAVALARRAHRFPFEAIDRTLEVALLHRDIRERVPRRRRARIESDRRFVVLHRVRGAQCAYLGLPAEYERFGDARRMLWRIRVVGKRREIEDCLPP